MHQLETLLESSVDKRFDLFEIWTLRNILTIPDDLAPWMRLGHCEVCSTLHPSSTGTDLSLLGCGHDPDGGDRTFNFLFPPLRLRLNLSSCYGAKFRKLGS